MVLFFWERISCYRMEALNVGKTLREAEGDIDDAIGAFNHCANLAETCPTEEKFDRLVETSDPDVKGTITHDPIGVVGGITPWNYPVMMAAWKVAPALAAGCSIVIKPSEVSPYTTLKFAECMHEAGIPPGVFNVVLGDRQTGADLSSHPGLRKLSFTGSVTAGTHVMKSAAEGVRPVVLELGGKSPAVVLDDAHLETTVEWLMFGKPKNH